MAAYTNPDQNQVLEAGDIVKFIYTGTLAALDLPPGCYRVKCSGAAGGGDLRCPAGKGAQVSGVLEIKEARTLYMYVGGRNVNSETGGWNGGGNGVSGFGGCGGGGGASDIRLLPGSWNDADSLRSRIMTAGGGGGGPSVNYHNSYHNSGFCRAGGNAGGLNGSDSPAGGAQWGRGGAQTKGGDPCVSGGYTSGAGSFGRGGNGNSDSQAAGGGAGYYGGSGAARIPGTLANGGGGGGSSFISGHTGCNAINEDGTHTGQPIHYSGLLFTETDMEEGINAEAGLIELTVISISIPKFDIMAADAISIKHGNKYNRIACDVIPGKLQGGIIKRFDIAVSESVDAYKLKDILLSPILNNPINAIHLNTLLHNNLSDSLRMPVIIDLAHLTMSDGQIRLLRIEIDYERSGVLNTCYTFYYIAYWKGNFIIGTDIYIFKPIEILQPRYISFCTAVMDEYCDISFYYSRDDGNSFQAGLNHLTADMTGMHNADVVRCILSVKDTNFDTNGVFNGKAIIKAF